MEKTKERKPARFRGSCSGQVVLLAFALISLSGWVRTWQAISSGDWLNRAGVPSTYLAISGVLWGGIGLIVFLWLWLERRWMGVAAFVGVLVVAVTYWVDRLALGKAYGLEVNLPFAIAFTLVALALIFWLVRPDLEVKERNQNG